MLVGAILVLCGLGLVLWNIKENYRAGIDSERIMQELVPIITMNGEAAREAEPESGIETVDYEMPVKEVNGRPYIGVLMIPDLKMEVPIQQKWDARGLEISPCRYSGDVVTRDMVICGHNYNNHFGRLQNLQEGAEVYLVTMKGTVLNYRVAAVENLKATDIVGMKESPYDLTLFTCTIGGATRITVRCNME